MLALAVLVRTAWVCDDAYITFRVADNFVYGYGLRWNVDERVAVFTHPLWLFLFSSLYAITREAYYTAICLGIGLTLITMLGVAVRVASGASVGALALVALLSSKAFVDFSTSGLENPLTNLLLIVFVLQWARRDEGPRALLGLWGSAALVLVNRLDLVLLVAPALAAATVISAQRIGRGAAIRAAIVGMTPLIAWMAFSMIYFGFPVPNTAYAKLDTGVSSLALVKQGLYFVGLGFRFDPVTLLMIAAAPAALAFRRSRSDWPLVLGMLLTVAYVIRIGGDFMYGRFLTAPFFVSLLILGLVAQRLSWSQAGLAAAAILGVACRRPTSHRCWPMRTSGRATRRTRISKRAGSTMSADGITRKPGCFGKRWARSIRITRGRTTA